MLVGMMLGRMTSLDTDDRINLQDEQAQVGFGGSLGPKPGDKHRSIFAGLLTWQAEMHIAESVFFTH